MWVKVLEAMAGVRGGELGEALSLGTDNSSGAGAHRQSDVGIRGWGVRGRVGLDLRHKAMGDRLNGVCESASQGVMCIEQKHSWQEKRILEVSLKPLC